MGDRNSGILLGLIIGTIIAIALLNKKPETVTAQATKSSQSSRIDWQPIDIPRVDDIIKTQQIEQAKMAQIQFSQTQIQAYDTKLNQIESQLERTTLNLEQATSKLLELNSAISKIKDEKQIRPTAPIQPVFIQPQPPQVIVYPIENKTAPILQPISQPIKSQIKNIEKVNNNEQSPIKVQDTLYKNNEKWDIKRGQDGRIKSLNIIREIKKWEP